MLCDTSVIWHQSTAVILVELDECASNPCQQAAPCLDLINQYECVCPPGYTGANCETGKYTFKQNGLINLLSVTEYNCSKYFE